MEKGEDVCEKKVCASWFLIRTDQQCGIFREITLYLVLRRLGCFSRTSFNRGEVAELTKKDCMAIYSVIGFAVLLLLLLFYPEF